MVKVQSYLTKSFLLIFLCFSCNGTIENSEVVNNENQIQDSIPLAKENIQHNEELIKEVAEPIIFKSKMCDYNSKIDSTFLFKAWCYGLDDPSASFQISKKEFFCVDFDGIGPKSYVLQGNNIKISDENYTDEGDIVKLTKDSLHIKWKATEITMKYIVWKDNE